ncbi:3,4-dihydroxy-2-butanone-4-phosphate synthase [Nitrosopumilus ureiphilus]|nr:3,4-dihydroxy-2-butanone-4-phosphate synthase [Nitrosopumilus ureiphilus]
MLDKALDYLKRGHFILLHDSSDRENEVDMVISAKHVTPEHIAQMRQFAGGLICIAVDDIISRNLKLQYMHESLQQYSVDEHKDMIYNSTKYGDHPSFSMWINHTEVKTGITDYDRALTANEMARVAEMPEPYQINYFKRMFKVPGHIPLLKSAPDLIKTRQGHTEMSTYLLRLAEMSPVSVICEMMDSITHKALSLDKAKKYADSNRIPMLEASEILNHSKIYA